MTATVKRLVNCWTIALLAAAYPVAAGPDLRVVDAAKSQNHSALRALLKQGVDVRVAEPDGTTALHWAAYLDDGDAVDLLVRADADVNAKNDLGATPLWLAATEGRAPMIDRLLRAGADPNAALRLGETPVMTASRSGNVEAVKLLIARGADVNAKERSRGQTALMWAVAQGHPQVVRVLTENGADVSARSNVRPMLVSVGTRGLGTDAYTDLYEEPTGGFTPLLFAARHNDVASATILLAAGAKVDEAAPTGATALVVATHSGQWATATFLLEHGADPNAAGAGYTALHAAMLRSNVDFVKALLARGANPNARVTRATRARRLSRTDVSIDPDWVGGTAYWLAASLVDADLMRLLVGAGADPHVVNQDGVTALMAAAAGTPGSGGASASRATERPTTPQQELEQRMLESVTLALELGADVNGADKTGETALHIAAARRIDPVVQLLADRGAALNRKTNDGMTPLAAARQVVGPGATSGSALRYRPSRTDTSTADLLLKLGAVE
jgi:ankyrin repeat protein